MSLFWTKKNKIDTKTDKLFFHWHRRVLVFDVSMNCEKRQVALPCVEYKGNTSKNALGLKFEVRVFCLKNQVYVHVKKKVRTKDSYKQQKERIIYFAAFFLSFNKPFSFFPVGISMDVPAHLGGDSKSIFALLMLKKKKKNLETKLLKVKINCKKCSKINIK